MEVILGCAQSPRQISPGYDGLGHGLVEAHVNGEGQSYEFPIMHEIWRPSEVVVVVGTGGVVITAAQVPPQLLRACGGHVVLN